MFYNDTKKWLDYLYYFVGRQLTNFRLCNTRICDDEIIFSRWKKYLDIQETKKINYVNQRTLLKNEIVLDFDNYNLFKGFKSAINKLILNKRKFYAYQTEEERCKHIHIFLEKILFFTKTERENYREKFIEYYGGDTALKSDNHMIPIENVNHWKTGKIKKVIYKNG